MHFVAIITAARPTSIIMEPTFYDKSERRWKIFLGVFFLISLAVGLSVGGLILSILNNNALLQPGLSQEVSVTPAQELPEVLVEKSTDTSTNNLTFLDLKLRVGIAQTVTPPLATSGTNTQIMAYYVNWDANSLESLKQNAPKLNMLIPEWLHLADSLGNIELDDKNQQLKVLDYLNKAAPELKIMPLINNYDTKAHTWDDRALTQLLTNQQAQNTLIDSLYYYVSSNGFSGINLDFENFSPQYYDLYLQFLQNLKAKFAAENYLVAVSVPFNEVGLNYSQMAAVTDYVMLMAYDERYSLNTAGPVASQVWFLDHIYLRSLDIPKAKMIVGLGNYGYDWPDGGGLEHEGIELTYQNVVQLARSKNAVIRFDPYWLNPYLDYTDANGRPHQVWFLDGVTAYNQIASAGKYAPAGYVVWRLGSEDPSIWTAFEQNAEKMTVVDPGYGIQYIGAGEILKVTNTPTADKRKIAFDAQTGFIYNQEVEGFGSPYVVQKTGGGNLKKVVLTFDDGPDKLYTPQILDILKAHQIKATFFVIGTKVSTEPDLLKRIAAEGHEIGIHTFTHPNIHHISVQQLEMEINASQKLITSLTGLQTKLFRPPYGDDLQPQTTTDLTHLNKIGELGYYTVGFGVDPKDWQNPGVSYIVENTLSQLNSGRGNIVLLHDAGGSRRQTLLALPTLITQLKNQGYEFVDVSTLLGVPRSQIMPSVNPSFQPGFKLLTGLQTTMSLIFKIGIVFGLARLIVIIFSALAQKVVRNKTSYPLITPGMSVIIPAYNESVVIVKSVKKLLRLKYPDFNIIVVDDGSTDNTYQLALKNFADHPKVKILKSPQNAGKAAALNLGIQASEYDFVVVQDSDTVLAKQALTFLARHFADERVGAVAGNVKVGNRVNLLTRLQAAEYITSQNLDRRAYDLFNCINVVPGAISAWRKSAIQAAGGFSSKTLAEDGELTLRIAALGYKVMYEERALGYTEAPQDVKSFLKQRFRWMYGTMQYLAEHAKMIFNLKFGYLGLFSLPNVLVFQVIFPLLGPFMDLSLLLMLLYNYSQKSQHPSYDLLSLKINLLSFGVFILVDIITQIIAFSMERNEDYKLILLFPFSRLFYRPLLYFTAIKCLVTAIKGPLVGWNKLIRTGTVKATVS
ncbi:MAG: polysaccharide deacetylase family protein [bacterium]